MADQLKNLMIGLFVIAAVTIIILVLLFLHPSPGDEGKRLRVRFANIDKINIGTRVTFGGKPVGEVKEIRELPDAINQRLEYNGFVYVYELDLLVDSDVNVFNTDEVSARTSGLLGEKSIAITPHAPAPGQQLIKVNDRIIYASETATVEETLKEFKELADKLELALDLASDHLIDLRKQDLWAKLGKIGDNVVSITSSLNKPDELAATVENFADLSAMAVDSWETIDTSVNNLSDVIVNVKAGKGTAGAILVKDDIYLKLNALLNKADTVLNDINHYGLLFHSDRGWQRLRSRRLNLLGQLKTPQEFRNFFNDEIDQISTSISRVSMLLQNEEGFTNCEELIDNCDFVKVYAELLRRVESLQESVKMYNQQVCDVGTCRTELGAPEVRTNVSQPPCPG